MDGGKTGNKKRDLWIAILGFLTAVVTTLGAGFAGAPLPNRHLADQNQRLADQNLHLADQIEMLTRKKLSNFDTIPDDYEWQWAGANWLGSVAFEASAKGPIKMNLDMYEYGANPTDKGKAERIFWSETSGFVTPNEAGGFSFEIPIHLEPSYREREHAGFSVLSGILKPVDAFAGRVQYKGQGSAVQSGDIVLVRSKSDKRSWTAAK